MKTNPSLVEQIAGNSNNQVVASTVICSQEKMLLDSSDHTAGSSVDCMVAEENIGESYRTCMQSSYSSDSSFTAMEGRNSSDK